MLIGNIVTIIISSKHMEAKLCCLILALQMVSLVSATSRPLATNNVVVGAKHPVTGQIPKSAHVTMGSKSSFQDVNIMPEVQGQAANIDGAAYSKGLSRIGSSPPSCEHKCYGCSPCEAIQVPTISKKHTHLGVNYANYEPEGWKCKCGPSFYSP